MRDFLDFRRMIAPDLIKLAFWLAVLPSIGVGVLALIRGSDPEFLRSIAPLNPNGLALLLIIVVPLALRIWAEFLVVIFEIHRNLEDIQRNTRRSGDSGADGSWTMPTIDTQLDPCSRLEAIDVAASEVWDEFALDADGNLSEQIEELEREPRDYLRAARTLRHQADLVGEELGERPTGRERAVAQASRELSSALDVLASYARTLAMYRAKVTSEASSDNQLALLEHDFKVLYRTFADTMTGIEGSFIPAFSVE